MQGADKTLVNAGTEAAMANSAAQMNEGYFLVWIAIWIIALAVLLPSLM